MNILKCALQAGGIRIWKCWFFMEGGKPENPEKNPRSKDENQQQTQPTYDTGTGNRTRATLVEGQCFHHCTIPAPPPKKMSAVKITADMHGHL